MLRDYALPPQLRPSAVSQTQLAVDRPELTLEHVEPNRDELAAIVSELTGAGNAALAALDDEPLLAAWDDTVAAFLDPSSAERRGLDPALAVTTQLSMAGLAAGLEVVLRGQHGAPVRQLAERMRGCRGNVANSTMLVVLAGNLPGLALQQLLPALLARRPILLKSARAEPLFTPAFLGALVARLPALAPAVAALTWRGGDSDLEAPLLAAAAPIFAYGETATIADLTARATGPVFGFGPKVSLAVIADETDLDLDQTAAGLAGDIALFDQRGCLSVHAVWVVGPAAAQRARELAAALASSLAGIALRLPPGPRHGETAASRGAARHLRELAQLVHPELLGPLADLPLAAGTVLLTDPLATPNFETSPGGRAVRVVAVSRPEALLNSLAPWRDRLQGVALAGEAAWQLAEPLTALGVSRFAAPGALQAADASWINGGIDPVTVYAAG